MMYKSILRAAAVCGVAILVASCAVNAQSQGAAGAAQPATSAIAPVKGMPANPFSGASFYVNSDYAREVEGSLTKVLPGSEQAKKIKAIESVSTAVWLDRIAAIAGGAKNGGRKSLAAHLFSAKQQAGIVKKPVVLPLVIYDLPNRDCAALASNGELTGARGLEIYKKSYIDVIYQILSTRKNDNSLRIAAVIEPDSLPNMITNLQLSSCAEVNSQGYYVDGVTYAIQKLGSLPNVAIYLDIGHSGWLGWPDNMQRAVTLYSELIKNAGAGLVRGLATDIANYTPVVEPFLNATNQAVFSGAFYQWNPAFDESTYVKLLNEKFSAVGLSGLGFIIDTSRSGWKKVNDGQPIDKRQLRGNWCNIKLAGLGDLPRASPSSYLPVDAFAWIKPPGESDGSSQVTTVGNLPDAEGKRFDPNCDPNNPRLDAAFGAPPAGKWFHTMFMQLINNAQPPVSYTPGL